MSIPSLECRSPVYASGLTFPFAILFWCFFFSWHASINFSSKGLHPPESSLNKIGQSHTKEHLADFTSTSETDNKQYPPVQNPQGFCLIKTGCEGYLISDFNIGHVQPSEPSPGQHTACVLKSYSPSHGDFAPVLLPSRHSVQDAHIGLLKGGLIN